MRRRVDGDVVASHDAAQELDRREQRRLAALRRLGLLDAGGDAALERLARVAAVAVGAPTALVSPVDERRQYFAGEAELGVFAYAGMPLADPDGTVLGSLCVIDDKPRVWTEAELGVLADVASAVEAELGYRVRLADAAARLALLTDITVALHSELDIDAALTGLTERVVPALADVCSIDLVTGADQHLRTAAVGATRPRLAELLTAAEELGPRRDNPASAVHRVLAGGPGELVEVTGNVLDRLRLTPEGRAYYDEMDLRSVV